VNPHRDSRATARNPKLKDRDSILAFFGDEAKEIDVVNDNINMTVFWKMYRSDGLFDFWCEGEIGTETDMRFFRVKK
jgi:hypothetical protein